MWERSKDRERGNYELIINRTKSIEYSTNVSPVKFEYVQRNAREVYQEDEHKGKQKCHNQRIDNSAVDP